VRILEWKWAESSLSNGWLGTTIPSILVKESRVNVILPGLRCLEPDPPVDWSCLKYRATSPVVNLSKVPSGREMTVEKLGLSLFIGVLRDNWSSPSAE